MIETATATRSLNASGVVMHMNWSCHWYFEVREVEEQRITKFVK
jgi:hypothetical protein